MDGAVGNGEWGPFQLNAAPLDLDAGPINLPFQLIKIRPAIEKSLPSFNRVSSLSQL